MGVQGTLGARDPEHLQGAKFMNRSLGISFLGLDATTKSLKGLGKYFIWEKDIWRTISLGLRR